MIEALYYFMLGAIVMFATLYLLGQWHEWREDERNRKADEDAERRIRQLDPLTDPADAWIPSRWPIRRNVR